MAHPYWPLFDLEVRTPRLTLRYIDDELGVELAALAARGIHDPGFMPFGVPWTDEPSPAMERQAIQFYWRTRASCGPESWNVQFAVLVDDEVVGSTGLEAQQFPALRTFETGSWLGRAYQGQGLGTEMRVATLHVGFVALDALVATTGAFADNAPSLGVTSKLAYEPNGTGVQVRRGERTEILRFQMRRQHFLDELRRDDVEIAGDEPVRELLGVSR